ncbi:class I SAM-dependent methyltransferase [Rhodovulum sp. YNF3179]
MTVDHSKSYKGYGVRAIGHRHRLVTIFKELEAFEIYKNGTFCDLGCSNGYITEKIRHHFDLEAFGFDRNSENIEIGTLKYPNVKFGQVDLNQPYGGSQTFDLVTCFETLEHVGNLKAAVQNILKRIAPGGKALISVPIERGMRGIFKYTIKKIIFGYSVSELGISEAEYFRILFSGRRLSNARPPADGYGTHFGFDYKDIDDALLEYEANYTARNSGMTRFYKIFG